MDIGLQGKCLNVLEYTRFLRRVAPLKANVAHASS